MTEIRRLKLKFMIFNMMLITAVMGVTFLAAAFVVKGRGRQETDTVLSRAVGNPGQEALIFEIASPVRVPHFSVLVHPDGSVVLLDGVYNSFPSQQFLEEVALMGMEKEQGLLSDYNLRFLRVAHPSGYLIAFADTSYENSLFSGMLRNGALVCILIWLGFWVLSWIFANWAVRPLESSMKMQKQFVADASHELKTPLTVITANAELLGESCRGISPDADKWLDNVNEECRNMRGLVESLLTLARSDARAARTRSAENHQEVPFHDLLMEVILTFEPVFYQAQKTLEYELCGDVWVKGDPDQLKQVIRILLDNAVKYSVPGGKTLVTLSLQHRRWRKSLVCLRVNSEGNEIPREQRKAIFGRFYRGESSRSTPGSCGLGLAIAEETVRQHRAVIGLECRDGWNCFYVRMKAASP